MPVHTRTPMLILRYFVVKCHKEYFNIKTYKKKGSLHVRVKTAYNVPHKTRTQWSISRYFEMAYNVPLDIRIARDVKS